ncbi:MAG: hypothetical protein GX810_03180 [Clostridiales bacterium]|nr:hypothetical protein [Clostridiales bacterium]
MPDTLWAVLAEIVLLPVVYYLMDYVRRRRLLARLREGWGTDRALRNLDADELSDIAHHHRQRNLIHPADMPVDDTTWNDLDMDKVFTGMDAATSIVGSQALYTMLREQGTTDEGIARRAALAQAFGKDESLRLPVQAAVFGIGRYAFHGAWRYLFSKEFQHPRWAWVYPVLALLPFTLALLGFVHSVFLLLAAGAFLVNLVVYYRTQATWKMEIVSIRHLGAVLNCARKLSRVDHPALDEVRKRIRAHSAPIRPVRFWLPLFGAQTVGDMALVLEYLRILFMIDMVSMVAIVRGINRNMKDVRALYDLVGEVDATLSIAQYTQRVPGLCAPVFTEKRGMCFTDLAHPLLTDAVTNDLDWTRDVLISGANASGKSTFIKAVAVNAILAQTVGLCHATALTMCRGRVMTAMAVRDSLLSGESYFVVEIKSLGRILDAMDGAMVYAFIDEILRGTNTIERIAASSAVLSAIAKRHALCMAATHDIELTRLLDPAYQNLHFAETVDDDGIRFDFLLREGPTRTRNAIRLLATMGYPEDIIAAANENARRFEQTGRWEMDKEPGGPTGA